MNVTIAELESYLLDHYENGGIDESLFMKLVEEIGEVAEVLNKKAERKKSDSEDLQSQLGNELAAGYGQFFAEPDLPDTGI